MTPIRGTLEALGIPQRQFAEMVDVDYTTVKRWANGTARTPFVITLVLRALQEGRITRRWIDKACALDRVEKSPQ